jgi:DNA-binding YbaB/EbfC family protein
LGNLMQQAQRMQENLKKAQEELAHIEVTGQAGGGMVQVTLSGRMECRRVRIEPSALEDAEMLEDLVAAAVNDAVNKANEASQARMAEATAGMPLPAGMKLPF